jgi:proteasome accessory factor A
MRAGLKEIALTDQVDLAVNNAPRDTRAFFRGEMLKRWPDHVVTANWDSLVLDLGEGPLVRVPMDEPGRGTNALIGGILDEAATPADVLRLIKERVEQEDRSTRG